MKWFLRLVAIGSISLLSLTCGKSTSPYLDQSEQVDFADWALVDTQAVFLVNGFGTGICEPFVDGDYMTGEPFIDMNDNGVYDRGVDIFNRCDCEDNQDLNFNGKYDAPGSLWDPDLPYDDLNHNGISDAPDGIYSPGEPYCDVNRNGAYDNVLTRTAIPVKRRLFEVTDQDTSYALVKTDSIWNYLSDSGVIFSLPPHDQVVDDSGYFVGFRGLGVVLNGNGLCYKGTEAFSPEVTAQFLFPILPRGIVDTGSAVIEIRSMIDTSLTARGRRVISVGQKLTVDNKTYNNLLRIRIDSLVSGDTELDARLSGTTLELYLLRGWGLVGVFAHEDDSELYSGAYDRQFYVAEIVDSLPMNMTTLNQTP